MKQQKLILDSIKQCVRLKNDVIKINWYDSGDKKYTSKNPVFKKMVEEIRDGLSKIVGDYKLAEISSDDGVSIDFEIMPAARQRILDQDNPDDSDAIAFAAVEFMEQNKQAIAGVIGSAIKKANAADKSLEIPEFTEDFDTDTAEDNVYIKIDLY